MKVERHSDPEGNGAHPPGKRRPQRFTQADVAHRLGYRSAGSYARMEHGKRKQMVPPAIFWALGEVLELTPEEMLEAAGYLPSQKIKIELLPLVHELTQLDELDALSEPSM